VLAGGEGGLQGVAQEVRVIRIAEIGLEPIRAILRDSNGEVDPQLVKVTVVVEIDPIIVD
jgi:hypothetical protein